MKPVCVWSNAVVFAVAFAVAAWAWIEKQNRIDNSIAAVIWMILLFIVSVFISNTPESFSFIFNCQFHGYIFNY
jgi:membrane protein YdbS with pleckstrin-like domain